MATIDPNDPLFRPVSINQAMEITGRSRDTIERWVRQKRITRYEVQHGRRVLVFNELEVIEAEKAVRDSPRGRPIKAQHGQRLDGGEKSAPS